jgi:hypothetical protein
MGPVILQKLAGAFWRKGTMVAVRDFVIPKKKMQMKILASVAPLKAKEPMETLFETEIFPTDKSHQFLEIFDGGTLRGRLSVGKGAEGNPFRLVVFTERMGYRKGSK